MIKHNKVLGWVVAGAVLLVGFLLVFVVDYGYIADRFKAIGFEPSDEMRGLMEEIEVTQRADVILGATRPALLAEDEFNDVCQSHNVEVAVLGCYADGQIYIYNVESAELAGIRQATLAHELLHAVWARMSGRQRQDLEAELQVVYEQRGESWVERLEKYPEESFFDELHSIVGTEVNVDELGGGLREHYEQFFEAPLRIVGFFEAYNEKFVELKAEAERLYAEITGRQEAIKAKTANYEDGMTELNAAIDDFNRRAAGGHFTSVAAFNAERAGLVARQGALSRMYEELAGLVAGTNGLIEQYNANVGRTRVLVDSVNSNAARSSEIK
jgi:hypothetical protein